MPYPKARDTDMGMCTQDNFQKNLSKCISPSHFTTFILSNADGAHSSDQYTTLECRIKVLILAYGVAVAKLFTEIQLCRYY